MKIRTKHHADQLLALIEPDRFADEQLEGMRVAFKGGDKRQLATAIQLCAGYGRVLPSWVADAFIAGFKKVTEFEVNTWDEILGGNPTGKSLAIAKKNRRLTLAIVQHIEDEPKFKANKANFEAIALRIGNGTTAALITKLYYQLPDAIRVTAERPRPNRRKKS